MAQLVNTIKVMWSLSINLSTLFLDRLHKLFTVRLHTKFATLLESVAGREWLTKSLRKICSRTEDQTCDLPNITKTA